MVKNSPAALEKIAVVNVGPGMEFDASVLTGDVAKSWKTMLTEIRPKLQILKRSLASGVILVHQSEIVTQNMLIVHW